MGIDPTRSTIAVTCGCKALTRIEKTMTSGPVDLVFDEFASGHVPATLHHYCSTETLMAIVTSKCIRLSPLSMSNDSEEGRFVLKLAEELGAVSRSNLTLYVRSANI